MFVGRHASGRRIGGWNVAAGGRRDTSGPVGGTNAGMAVEREGLVSVLYIRLKKTIKFLHHGGR
jgi:hypothetical protein